MLSRSWTYDVFGNRTSETVSDQTSVNPSCTAPQPLEYALTNQLLVRHSAPGCPNYAHYWSDQAGQRLGATDSLSQLPGVREALTYTAQGQLYYAVSQTDSPGYYDFNWNWGACPERSEGMPKDSGSWRRSTSRTASPPRPTR